MTWVIVFAALGVAALVAVAVCAWPVWREGVALTRQLGKASQSLGDGLEPLTAALDQLGEAQGSSVRR
jgi:predicted PurR-regulated permease PerM